MRDEPKFSEELKKMEHEPLLPVEKKLIAGSLLLGAGVSHCAKIFPLQP